MVHNWARKVKHHFHEVLKTKRTPESIALGFAIGTFIAVLPTPFIHIFIAVLVVLIFENINKYAVILALIFWNPIVLIPIYYLSYQTGDFIFGSIPSDRFRITMLNAAYDYSTKYIAGSLILALPLSVISYFIVFYLAKKFQHH